MQKDEFYDLCYRHDWYASRSDSYTVYKNAEDDYRRLRAIAKNDSELEPILEEFCIAYRRGQKMPTKEECGIHG